MLGRHEEKIIYENRYACPEIRDSIPTNRLVRGGEERGHEMRILQTTLRLYDEH